MTTSLTYTRIQAMERLGLTARSAFHYLREQYPQWFVVVQAGHGRNNPTLYDAQKIDVFAQARQILTPKSKLPEQSPIIRNKGKQS